MNSKYITLILDSEVDIGPLDIETNNFQFQNIDTYNWNLEGFSISNESLLYEF